MKKTLIASLCTLLLAVSCVDLDLAPKNIVTADDLLSNEAGMEIYLARMYSHMPFENFKYMAQWGYEYNGWLSAMVSKARARPSTATASVRRSPASARPTGAMRSNCCATPTTCSKRCPNTGDRSAR